MSSQTMSTIDGFCDSSNFIIKNGIPFFNYSGNSYSEKLKNGMSLNDLLEISEFDSINSGFLTSSETFNDTGKTLQHHDYDAIEKYDIKEIKTRNFQTNQSQVVFGVGKNTHQKLGNFKRKQKSREMYRWIDWYNNYCRGLRILGEIIDEKRPIRMNDKKKMRNSDRTYIRKRGLMKKFKKLKTRQRKPNIRQDGYELKLFMNEQEMPDGDEYSGYDYDPSQFEDEDYGDDYDDEEYNDQPYWCACCYYL
jgi:hypothetical protein